MRYLFLILLFTGCNTPEKQESCQQDIERIVNYPKETVEICEQYIKDKEIINCNIIK